MLVRTIRLTDKFSNALLRIVIWLGQMMLLQAYQLRITLVSSAETLWFMLTQSFSSGRVIYVDSVERRRAIMARRAVEETIRGGIREDPLKSQNRALSMFAVVLLASLIVLVLWITNSAQGGPFISRGAGGPLPLQTKAPPTPLPTETPTQTPIPDPLRTGGSVVYSMREQGHDNLWVLGIGQATPIRLTNTTQDDRDPAWSPDGTKIAFSSHRDGNWELYIMEVATNQITRLTTTLDYEGSPTWSPDAAFIAYEGYQNNKLDVYIIEVKTGKIVQVTRSPGPNFSPAWSPDGTQIAYVSLRDGNQEIYVASLRPVLNDAAVRMTRTSDVDEDYPTWSPDGKTLAYSAHVNGDDLVYVKPVAQPDSEPVTIARGRQPTWSPSGASLLVAVDNPHGGTTLVGAQVANYGVAVSAFSRNFHINRPNWTAHNLPDSLLQGQGLNAYTPPALFTEVDHTQAGSFTQLAQLDGVKASNPTLSDAVDDSFKALRVAVVNAVGFDFLGNIKEAMWGLNRLPEPGQNRQSWHYAGRAFDFDKFLVYGDVPPIEVVREEVGVNVYWHVYLRVPDQYQGGQLGEPLKRLPWDFASRTSGDPQTFEQGGQKKAHVSAGYYVDFTLLASDYGWTNIASERIWRTNFSSLLYWEYDKRENLSWNDAMAQLYPQDQIQAFLNGPTAIPVTPQPTDTPGSRRTPTPIPPDQK